MEFQLHLNIQVCFFYDSQDSRGREGIIFYSTLPLPLYHEHSDIYLQFCMRDDYHIILIAWLNLPGCYSMKFTTLSNCHLIDWWCEVRFVCLLDYLTLGFCYSNLDRGSRWTQTRIEFHPCITNKPTNTNHLAYVINKAGKSQQSLIAKSLIK